jgi:hypothetical protein
MEGETGSGNGGSLKALWTVVIAAGSLVLNAGVFVVNRLFTMDTQQMELRVAIEQRLTRMEQKLDALMRDRVAARHGR